MTRQRHWQDAGRERQLGVGDVVSVPDAIGDALIATGAAVAFATAAGSPARADAAPFEAAVTVPEETGARRRR